MEQIYYWYFWRYICSLSILIYFSYGRSAIFIVKVAPVESINRELDSDEKIHCKKVTMRILFGIILFTGCCTVGGMSNTVSLIALTVLVILISQYVGIVKFKIEKSKNER